MSKAIIYSIISHLIVLGIGYYLGSQNRTIERIETIKVDTLYKYITITDTVETVRYSYKYIKGKDVNVDSLWKEAKEYWHNIIKDSIAAVYVASIDTMYKDSSLTARVSFNSPIPLHPRSYFTMDYKIKEKTIEKIKMIYEQTSFWKNRFILYLGLGINYNNNQVNQGIQLGVGVRIL